MGFKIGVIGAGDFGPHFVPLFAAHPAVDEVVVADLIRERAEKAAADSGLSRVMGSLDEVLESDVDAVALFTQRWTHAPMAVKALKAGKHVYSAVPAAVKIDELHELVDTVKETGRMYMLGETSFYRPQTIYCRERFHAGEFGRFVYGEGQYHHDMAHFYRFYKHSGGKNWKSTASFPPMLYPTHSVSHILGVTFSRMTAVSCFGFRDNHIDGIFRPEISQWGNPFSNETALFRTADGGAARINEFRRVAAGESRQTIMGTMAAYEEQTDHGIYTWWDFPDEAYRNGDRNGEPDYDKIFDLAKLNKRDLSHIRRYDGVEITEENLGDLPREYLGRKHLDVTPVHHVERLPGEFVGLPNRHCGSHQFLVVDFIEALQTGKLPPNNVWQAARYNAPGIMAHESAMKDGELLDIPDFGTPPDGSEYLDPMSVLQD